MSDVPETPAQQAARARLLRGQQLEAEGDFAGALRAYEEVVSISRQESLAELEVRRQLGVAWMNRGNALQKLAGYAETAPDRKTHLEGAVGSYDQAIASFQTLPHDVAAFRHHLGAAWLNRGHALMMLEENASAVDTLERAIAELSGLPLEKNPNYRLNLAGARANLAHVILSASPERSRAEATAALELVAAFADAHLEFAEMALRARHTIVTAIGELLLRPELPAAALASEASDIIDEGLGLTHRWEANGSQDLRPLAFRLFQFGIQLYGAYQPHFLAEFILENVGGPAAPFNDDPHFRRVAEAGISTALRHVNRPEFFVAGTPQSDRLLEISSSLRAARRQLESGGAAPSA